MQMATTLCRSTHTFLTHLFGPGLDDDRYHVKRFLSKADGEIHPRRRNGASKKSWGKASPRDRLRERRPADEARARRDHHLHGRQLHHPRRSILGGICYLGSYVAAMTSSSVLLAVEWAIDNIFSTRYVTDMIVAPTTRRHVMFEQLFTNPAQSGDTRPRRSSSRESDTFGTSQSPAPVDLRYGKSRSIRFACFMFWT